MPTLAARSATLVPNVPTTISWTGLDFQTVLGDSVVRSVARLTVTIANGTAAAVYVSASYQRLSVAEAVRLNGGNPIAAVAAGASGEVVLGEIVPDVSALSITFVSQAGGVLTAAPALDGRDVGVPGAGGAYVGAGARTALDYRVQTLSANVLMAPFANFAIVTYTVPAGKRAAIQSLVLQATITPSVPATLVVSLVVDITTHLFVRSETAFEARLALAGELLWLESGQQLTVQATNTDLTQSYLASGFVTLKEYLS